MMDLPKVSKSRVVSLIDSDAFINQSPDPAFFSGMDTLKALGGTVKVTCVTIVLITLSGHDG